MGPNPGGGNEVNFNLERLHLSSFNSHHDEASIPSCPPYRNASKTIGLTIPYVQYEHIPDPDH